MVKSGASKGDSRAAARRSPVTERLRGGPPPVSPDADACFAVRAAKGATDEATDRRDERARLDRHGVQWRREDKRHAPDEPAEVRSECGPEGIAGVEPDPPPHAKAFAHSDLAFPQAISHEATWAAGFARGH